jgi:hypothetical protein
MEHSRPLAIAAPSCYSNRASTAAMLLQSDWKAAHPPDHLVPDAMGRQARTRQRRPLLSSYRLQTDAIAGTGLMPDKPGRQTGWRLDGETELPDARLSQAARSASGSFQVCRPLGAVARRPGKGRAGSIDPMRAAQVPATDMAVWCHQRLPAKDHETAIDFGGNALSIAGCAQRHCNSSSSVFARLRIGASKPSVNQP